MSMSGSLNLTLSYSYWQQKGIVHINSNRFWQLYRQF